MSILRWLQDKRLHKKLEKEPQDIYNWVLKIKTKWRSLTKDPFPIYIGEWAECDKCGNMSYVRFSSQRYLRCDQCDNFIRMNSEHRVHSLLDSKSWRPMDELLSSFDPLEFVDTEPYNERLQKNQRVTGFPDAVQTGTGLINNIPIALGVMSFSFMGGSMGSVVGERITRLIEYATENGLSLVLVSTSGGARMQEGTFSLMQMGKISAALKVHQDYARLFFLSIITTPTMGGVTASFAMLGDIVIAEPETNIGFAGPRVIKQTLGEELPEGFQTAEFLFERGFLDLIVERRFLRATITKLMHFNKNAKYKKAGFRPNFINKTVPSQSGSGIFPKPVLVTAETLNAEYDEVQELVEQLELVAEVDRLCEDLDKFEAIIEKDQLIKTAFTVRKKELKKVRENIKAAEGTLRAAEKTIQTLTAELEDHIKHVEENTPKSYQSYTEQEDTEKEDTKKEGTKKEGTKKEDTKKPNIQTSTSKTTTNKPITSKTTTNKPTISKPTISKPTISKPTISKPTTSKPTTSQSTNIELLDIKLSDIRKMPIPKSLLNLPDKIEPSIDYIRGNDPKNVLNGKLNVRLDLLTSSKNKTETSKNKIEISKNKTETSKNKVEKNPSQIAQSTNIDINNIKTEDKKRKKKDKKQGKIRGKVRGKTIGNTKEGKKKGTN